MLRFRPIMMTTLAAMFGALPLAIMTGQGSEMRQPLGIAIVGGLFISQILTLYTTPVVYIYLDRFHLWFKRTFRRRSRGISHLPQAERNPHDPSRIVADRLRAGAHRLRGRTQLSSSRGAAVTGIQGRAAVDTGDAGADRERAVVDDLRRSGALLARQQVAVSNQNLKAAVASVLCRARGGGRHPRHLLSGHRRLRRRHAQRRLG